MSDQNVREIQLGGKQLVFLFMALLVGAVAVFLLGISVGRGVRDAAGETGVTTDVAVTGQPPTRAGEMPPATETTSADLGYHDQLQGQPLPSGSTQKEGTPVTEAPAVSEPASPPAAAPSAPPPATAKPAVPTPVPDRAVAKPATSAAASDAGWFVQVDAFRSRENADRRVSDLKGRGYASAAVSAGGPGTLFRVRVGPFAQRDEAERTRQRMASEGIKSSVQR